MHTQDLVLSAIRDYRCQLLLGFVAGEVEYLIPQLTYTTKPSPICI
jgi:hypothetical protein